MDAFAVFDVVASMYGYHIAEFDAKIVARN
jgi:hypothetical protein